MFGARNVMSETYLVGLNLQYNTLQLIKIFYSIP